MRLFVALNPTDAARRDWAAAIEPLHRYRWPVRWVAPEALHLTLHFFGHVDTARVAGIRAALTAAAALHEPFDLRVRRLGAFPSAARARVIWLAVEPDAHLLALQRDVAQALAAAGYPPEKRGFSPHITIARAKGDSARIAGMEEAMRGFHHDSVVPIRTVDLMKSTPGPGGARYERIAAAELGKR